MTLVRQGPEEVPSTFHDAMEINNLLSCIQMNASVYTKVHQEPPTFSKQVLSSIKVLYFGKT